MSKEGCSHCGRRPEDKAPACPKCGQEAPTRGHVAGFLERREQAICGGILLGMSIGILLGPDMAPLGPYRFILCFVVAVPGLLTLRLSKKGLDYPTTPHLWSRYLPGFPAVLLVPVILLVWVGLCSVPGRETDYLRSAGFMSYGFPYPIRSYLYDVAGGRPVALTNFSIPVFLIDLFLALAAAYFVAMVVDRLVLRWVRSRRGGIRSPAGDERC